MNIRRFNEHDYEAFQGAREFESGELPFIGEADITGFPIGELAGAAVVGSREGIEVCIVTADAQQGPTFALRLHGEKAIEAILRAMPDTLTPQTLGDFGLRSR